MKGRKPKSRLLQYRAVLPFLLAALFGVLAAAAGARGDELQARMDARDAQIETENLTALTERTERICTHLIEWQCPVSDARREELSVLIITDAAMARTNVGHLSLSREQSASAYRFFEDCSRISRENGGELCRYAQRFLCAAEDALSCARTGNITYAIPEYAASHATSVRAYDPAHDDIGWHEAQEYAMEYMGNPLSLRRASCTDDVPYYRFYCQNGFCDIRKSDGLLLRMAVYRDAGRDPLSMGAVKASLLEFFNRQHLRNPVCETAQAQDGMLSGTYYENGITAYTAISLSSAKIAAYDRCAGAQTSRSMPSSSLPCLTGESEPLLRTAPDGRSVYLSRFCMDDIGGEIIRDAKNGSVLQIRFRFHITDDLTGKQA